MANKVARQMSHLPCPAWYSENVSEIKRRDTSGAEKTISAPSYWEIRNDGPENERRAMQHGRSSVSSARRRHCRLTGDHQSNHSEGGRRQLSACQVLAGLCSKRTRRRSSRRRRRITGIIP